MGRWTTWTEVTHGLRLMRNSPFVAGTVILSLALGIGLATAGFTFLDSVLHGELPFENGDRFVRLQVFREPEGLPGDLGEDRYRLLRESAGSLSYLGLLNGGSFNLLHRSGEVEIVSGASLTPGWFRHLPCRPLAGRLLGPGDGRPGAVPVVLLRRSLWDRRYGSDPALIGRTVHVGGLPRTVVGVLPDTCEFPYSGELWLPLDPLASGPERGAAAPLTRLAGVLAGGVSLPAAREQVRRLLAQYEVDHPGAEAVRIDVTSMTDLSALGIEAPLVVATGMMTLVLLLVAANVANLLLARNAVRTPELAVRAAHGASRGRLVGQLFLEVLILGGVAAALGLAASQMALGWVERSIDADEFPFWIEFRPGAGTVVFVLLVTLAASAVAGVWPALRLTRHDLAFALRAAGRGAAGDRLGWFGGASIVMETTLAVALLSAALTLAWGFARYTRPDLDLPVDEILTAQVYVPPAPDADTAGPAETAAAVPAILRAAGEIPGVSRLGAASAVPGMSPPSETVLLESPGGGGGMTIRAPAVAVRPGFLEALDGAPLAGRLFREEDLEADAPPVAVVNRPFVERFLRGRNPVGLRLRAARSGGEAGDPPWREIVGVVPDLGLLLGDSRRTAGYYVPMREGNLFYLALRASGDPRRLGGPLRRAIYELDPHIIVDRITSIEGVAEEDRSALLAMSAVLTAVGGATLLLSLVGIYAAMSFTVTRRTREIGIRMALGARGGQVLRSVVGRAAALLAAGALLGSILALVLTRLLDRVLVSQLPHPGGWLLPGIILLLSAAGLMASWVPARRALRVAPAEALGQE